MKKLLWLILIPISLFAVEKQPPLTTQKVTVFLSGAQVSASAKVSLVEGNNTLLFSDLSPNIQPNSIQVKGLNRVSVNTIQFDITYLKEQAIAEDLQELKDKLANIKDKIAAKQSAISALETEESLLMQNKTIASTETNTSLVKLKEYAAYYRERSEQIYNALYQTKKQRDELQQELNKIQQEINQLEGQNRTSRGEIKLVLNSEINQSTMLEIDYIVQDAGWYPSYELRAESVNSPINLLYQATIFQHTGDDWKDVEVMLSTADPSLSFQKPNLAPFFLDFTYDEIINTFSNEKKLNEVAIRGSSSIRKIESASDEMISIPVKKNDQLTTVTFSLPKKQSVKSGDEPLKVKLDQQDLEAEYEYYSAPALDTKVFLTATLKDWQSLDLLPGEASIYFEDTFSGKIFLDANMNTEDFVVSLGSDQNIVIERKQINKMKSKTFFRNNEVVEKEYEISIKNNKNIPLELKLEDRIPISQNSEIKVSDETFEGAKRNEETGIITWMISIDAKTKQTQKFAYKVTYPKGKSINIER